MTRRLASIALSLHGALFCSLGFADTVALLPLRYEEVGAGDLGGDCAPCRGRVRQEIEAALTRHGHQLADAEAIAEGDAGAGVLQDCRNVEALEKLAAALGEAADRVICVWVRDETKNSATYAVRVAVTPGETREETNVGGLETIAADAAQMVIGSLATPLEQEALPDVVVEPAPPPKEAPPKEAPLEAEADAEIKTRGSEEQQPGGVVEPLALRGDTGRKIGAAPFWISAAVTGAFAAGYVTTEIVASRIYDDLRREDDVNKWRSLRSDFDAVQTADRVLLGLFAAGAATTLVLGLLTDFRDDFDSHEKGDELGFRVAPVITAEGTGVVFSKRF